VFFCHTVPLTAQRPSLSLWRSYFRFAVTNFSRRCRVRRRNRSTWFVGYGWRPPQPVSATRTRGRNLSGVIFAPTRRCCLPPGARWRHCITRPPLSSCCRPETTGRSSSGIWTSSETRYEWSPAAVQVDQINSRPTGICSVVCDAIACGMLTRIFVGPDLPMTLSEVQITVYARFWFELIQICVYLSSLGCWHRSQLLLRPCTVAMLTVRLRWKHDVIMTSFKVTVEAKPVVRCWQVRAVGGGVLA